MDVHAAHEKGPYFLVGNSEAPISFLRCRQLHTPVGERMCGRRNHGDTMPLRGIGNQVTGLLQSLAQFDEIGAYSGIGFDLRAQEFVNHGVRPAGPLAGFEDRRVRVGNQVPGFGIDQKELLFDSKRDVQIIIVHCFSPFAPLGSEQQGCYLRSSHISNQA